MECVTYAQLCQMIKELGPDYKIEENSYKKGADHAPMWQTCLTVAKGQSVMFYEVAAAATKSACLDIAATALYTQVKGLALKVGVVLPRTSQVATLRMQNSMQETKLAEERAAAAKAALDNAVEIDKAKFAHLELMYLHKACVNVSAALKSTNLAYLHLAPVLIGLIAGVDAAAAEAHNRLMHALNGNGLRSELHSVIDKVLDDARGMTAEQRQNMVIRAVKGQFGKRKPRSGERKKANNKQRAKNGNGPYVYSCLYCKSDEHEEDCPVVAVPCDPVCAAYDSYYNEQLRMHAQHLGQLLGVCCATSFAEVKQARLNAEAHAMNGNGDAVGNGTSDWFDELVQGPTTVRACDKAAANALAHAYNGNAEMTALAPPDVSGRTKPEYMNALDRFSVDCKKDGLTEAANLALMQMLDPCADVDRDTVDVPTGLIDHILTTRYAAEVSIGRPAGLAAGETWEVMICTDQFCGGQGGKTAGIIAGATLGTTVAQAGQDIYSADVTATAARGCIIAEPIIFHRKATSSTNTFFGSGAAIGAAGGELGCVPVPQTYTQNPFRITAIGFEVVNTTPMLTRGGVATAFEFPARKQDTMMNYITQWPIGVQVVGASDLVPVGTLGAPVWTQQDVRTISVQRPPATLAECSNSKGSRTWPAADGYYAPASWEDVMDVSNPIPTTAAWYTTAAPEGLPAGFNTMQVVYPGRGCDPVTGAIANRLVATSLSTGTTAIGGTVTTTFDWNGLVSNVRYVPTTRKGVLFSNLSFESTLTLRVVYYLTRVPQVTQIDLYTMSHKAPGYDPYFWSAYKHCQSLMPIGATFNENPLGEWFNTFTKYLAKAAPVIGNLVPGGAMVGQAVAGLSKAANRWNRGKTEKRPRSEYGREK